MSININSISKTDGTSKQNQSVLQQLRKMFYRSGELSSILAGNTIDELDVNNIGNLYGKRTYVYPRSKFKEDIILFIHKQTSYLFRVKSKKGIYKIQRSVAWFKVGKRTTNIDLKIPVPDCVMKGHISNSKQKKVAVFFITDVLNIGGNSLLNLSFEQRHQSLKNNGQIMKYLEGGQTTTIIRGERNIKELQKIVLVIQPYNVTKRLSIPSLSASLARYNIEDVTPETIIVGGLDDNYIENCTHTILSTPYDKIDSFKDDFLWKLGNKTNEVVERMRHAEVESKRIEFLHSLAVIMTHEKFKSSLTDNLEHLQKVNILFDGMKIPPKCFEMLDLPRRKWFVTVEDAATTVKIDQSPPIIIRKNSEWNKQVVFNIDLQLGGLKKIEFQKWNIVSKTKTGTNAVHFKRTMYKVSSYINIIVEEKQKGRTEVNPQYDEPRVYLEVLPGEVGSTRYYNVIKAIQSMLYTYNIIRGKKNTSQRRSDTSVS